MNKKFFSKIKSKLPKEKIKIVALFTAVLLILICSITALVYTEGVALTYNKDIKHVLNYDQISLMEFSGDFENSSSINNLLNQKLKKQNRVKFISKNKVILPILMYHHISNLDGVNPKDTTQVGLRVSPAVFDKQLSFMQKQGYKTIIAKDLDLYLKGEKDLPPKPILITIDDGWEDGYTNALPILKKYKMVADFEIVTSVIGSPSYMNETQIKDLYNQDMGISSHTHKHCYLAVNANPKTGTNGPFADSPINNQPDQECPEFTSGAQLNTGQIRGELSKSKNILEKIIGSSVNVITYPYGKYNNQVITIAKELGYTVGFTVEPQGKDNIVDLVLGPLRVKRIRVQGQQLGEGNNLPL